MRLDDEMLSKHKIIIAIVVIAAGLTLNQFGIDGAIIFLTGAASSYLARELFAHKGEETEAVEDGAEEG
jgi:hypothetical protein